VWKEKSKGGGERELLEKGGRRYAQRRSLSPEGGRKKRSISYFSHERPQRGEGHLGGPLRGGRKVERIFSSKGRKFVSLTKRGEKGLQPSLLQEISRGRGKEAYN